MIPVLGIDPGTQGGLAVLQSDGEPVLITPFRPYWTHAQLVGAVAHGFNILHAHQFHPRTVYLETVGVMPHDSLVSARTFMRVDGIIRGALLRGGAVIREAMPMLWQSRMGCLSGGDKNVTKHRAQELFPRVKVTHNIADALLIARYGWECLHL